MKGVRSILRHLFGLIPTLFVLMSVATLTLESVALARPDPIWISTGSLKIVGFTRRRYCPTARC